MLVVKVAVYGGIVSIFPKGTEIADAARASIMLFFCVWMGKSAKGGVVS